MKIYPSQLQRGVACLYSLVTESNKPNLTNQSAREGNAAHWIAEIELKGERKMNDMIGEVYEPDVDGIIITEEMVNYTRMYVDYCHSIGANSPETRLEFPDIHETCRGIVDNYSYTNNHLIVVDYKYGRKYVSPVNNIQLSLYTSQLAEQLRLSTCTPVTLVIVQPRSYHPSGPIREYHTMVGNVHHTRRLVGRLVQEAINGTPIAVSGSHCYKCPHLHNCTTAMAAGYNAIAYADVGELDHNDANPQSVSHQLHNIDEALEILNFRKAALEEMALMMLKCGRDVPGYTLRASYTKPKWTKSVEELSELGAALGIPLTKEVPVALGEAEKRGLSKESIASLSKKYPDGLQLEKINLDLVKMLFSKR